MTTMTPEPQSTETLDLETTLKALVDQHGIGAVGNALAQQHGRTQAIAAVLGYPFPHGANSDALA